MRPQITDVFPVSSNTWQVHYDFADVSFAMTVLASDAANARRKAAERLARAHVRAAAAHWIPSNTDPALEM